MAEAPVVRSEKRWFTIALGVVVLLAILYMVFGLMDEPTENVQTPTAPAEEAPPAVSP